MNIVIIGKDILQICKMIKHNLQSNVTVPPGVKLTLKRNDKFFKIHYVVGAAVAKNPFDATNSFDCVAGVPARHGARLVP